MRTPLSFLSLPLALLAALPAAAIADTPHPSFTVETTGHGRPILLIPGLACGGNVWDETVRRLAGHAEVHVITLAGFAGAPRVAAPILATARGELARWVKERGLDHPVVVGHSLGGFLALWLAASEPALFGGVVSVEGAPFLPGFTDPNATVESVRPMAEQIRAAVAHSFKQMSAAALLDLTQDAVKQRLSRARARLRGDLAAKLGVVLRATPPGAAFGAIITGAVASAASVAHASAVPATVAGVAKATSLASLLATLGGAAGVLFGYPYYRRLCADDAERRSVRLLALANLALVVALVALAGPARRFGPGWGEPALLYTFLAGVAWINLVVLPRRVRGMRRRDKLLNLAGFVVALVVATVAILGAL